MEQPIRIELPTIFGMSTVNCYLFKTPVPTLIDCGENTDASWHALQQQLKENKLQIADIERIIITHAHVDHIGMAQRIVEESNCKVWVTPLVYDWAVNLKQMKASRIQAFQTTFNDFVRGDDMFSQMFEAVQSLFENADTLWLEIDKSAVQAFSMESQLEMGNRNWSVIHVPGHCQNQTCFYDGYNADMISADMILKITPTPVIEFDPEEDDGRSRGLVKLLDSYQKIKALDIRRVYPGHYDVMGNPGDTIDYQVGRIHQRVEETYGYIEKGSSKISVLLQNLYANRISMPAANMLIGYLDILLADERIQLDEGNISIRK